MKLYFIAGEPSGDLHGKNLLSEIKNLRPDVECRGVGGDGLKSLGVQLVRHIRDTNFMGFVQVIRNLGVIRKLFKDVQADILDFKPDAVVLIDYPGFNLRMAKFCKKHGIRVLFYISPQVWAWKKSRVKKIRRDVDRMYVILPFEKEFYEKEQVEVEFVGHPLLDEVAEGNYAREEIRSQYLNGRSQLIALLPGSRKQEISRMLPRMLAVVNQFPDARFVIAGAPTQEPEFYHELLSKGGITLSSNSTPNHSSPHSDPSGKHSDADRPGESGNGLTPIGNHEVAVLHNRTYDLLSAADYALVTSGTATLEAALFQVPEIVCYAAGGLSVWLARRLIKVPYISLVNLIMDREVVRELIQQELNTENLVAELKKLMDPDHAEQLGRDYKELREKLGDVGASRRAAEGMIGYLEEN